MSSLLDVLHILCERFLVDDVDGLSVADFLRQCKVCRATRTYLCTHHVFWFGVATSCMGLSSRRTTCTLAKKEAPPPYVYVATRMTRGGRCLECGMTGGRASVLALVPALRKTWICRRCECIDGGFRRTLTRRDVQALILKRSATPYGFAPKRRLAVSSRRVLHGLVVARRTIPGSAHLYWARGVLRRLDEMLPVASSSPSSS